MRKLNAHNPSLFRYMRMPAVVSIPVVILTGGFGLRIGGNKASRILAGKSLLARSLEKACTYSAQFAVSTNKLNELDLPDGTVLLLDDTDNNGPISGLSSAINYAVAREADYVLIMPCDTPLLPVDLMSRLYTSIGEANAAVAFSNGRLHAACSLWRADVAKSLHGYLALGRRSLIGFAEAVGYVSVEWLLQPFDQFFNINTAEDMVKAESIITEISLLD
jgi:molybdenum cofactor guanylyltransferase